LPERQFEVRSYGKLVARVDFAYPQARLAIEVDGYRWHSGRARWQRDLQRRNRLIALGWRVLHATSEDIDGHPEVLIAMIETELTR
jgi:very-short-patch-repair endonuclease